MTKLRCRSSYGLATAAALGYLAASVSHATADVVVGLAAPATGREQPAGNAMREVAEKIIAGIN